MIFFKLSFIGSNSGHLKMVRRKRKHLTHLEMLEHSSIILKHQTTTFFSPGSIFVGRFGCLEDEQKQVLVSAHPPPKICKKLHYTETGID